VIYDLYLLEHVSCSFWVCLSCFWSLCLPWKHVKSMKHCTKQYKTYQHMAFRSCRVSSCYGRWCKKWQVPGSGHSTSWSNMCTHVFGHFWGGFNLFWSVLQLLQLICCLLSPGILLRNLLLKAKIKFITGSWRSRPMKAKYFTGHDFPFKCRVRKGHMGLYSIPSGNMYDVSDKHYNLKLLDIILTFQWHMHAHTHRQSAKNNKISTSFPASLQLSTSISAVTPWQISRISRCHWD